MPLAAPLAIDPFTVPDSEEERLRGASNDDDVIEISSEDTDAAPSPVRQAATARGRSWTATASRSKGYRELSNDVIELTDSSPERISKRVSNGSKPFSQPALEPPLSPHPVSLQDGGSLLVLHDLPGARKPHRLNSPTKPSTPRSVRQPKQKALTARAGSPTASEEEVIGLTKFVHDLPGPSTPIGTPSKAKRAPRPTKKALQEADFKHRADYAEKLFIELNRDVFNDGIPKDTALKWNKRMSSTAGKASWHRSSERGQISQIELADKILDCEERIRNTLSHEMCHLACWIIDEQLSEQHGRYFKAWARRVMKQRPDIAIDTRHNYEIKYKYEWRCNVETCGKIYGRFSKSINPDACVCGACKTGRLEPLFKTRARASPTKAMSTQAATNPTDSPQPAVRLPGAFPGLPLDDLDDAPNGSDSDILELTRAIECITVED